MTARKAANVWKICRSRHWDAHAYVVTKGALAGEHVVSIEQGHALTTKDVRDLVSIADGNQAQLSFGLTSRKALVLS